LDKGRRSSRDLIHAKSHKKGRPVKKKKTRVKTMSFDDLEKDGQAMLRFREVKMNQERVMRIRCVEKYLKRLGLI
jgi:hypothetical protein